MDVASYAKRVGEGLYQQAKELGILDSVAGTPQSKGRSSSSSGSGGAAVAGAATASGPPPTTLAARLQPHIVDGYILYNPGGPFQEYLLRVEDAVLLHLLRSDGSRP